MTTDIFDGVEFCAWPTRRDRAPHTVRWALHQGIRKQVGFLNRFLKGHEDKGAKWYLESCGIY